LLGLRQAGVLGLEQAGMLFWLRSRTGPISGQRRRLHVVEFSPCGLATAIMAAFTSLLQQI
jgi:hypothetical protein